LNLAGLQRAFEVAAVVFAALSGIVDARRKNLDLVGAFVVGLITAFGGGTLRDVLLERRPLFWVVRSEYPLIVLVLAILYLYAPSALKPLRRRRVQELANVLDAVALGLFGGLGVQAAVELGTPAFVAVLFGVMTGTFGGVLRDIVLNEVPLLFRPTMQLYATTVFAGGVAQVALLRLGVPASSALAIGAGVTIALRLAAIGFDWKLPPARPLRDET
jgi:uncharacterized membrane protein YeiH